MKLNDDTVERLAASGWRLEMATHENSWWFRKGGYALEVALGDFETESGEKYRCRLVYRLDGLKVRVAVGHAVGVADAVRATDAEARNALLKAHLKP